MADYYSSFSVQIETLTPEEEAWVRQDLAPVDTWDIADEAEIAALCARLELAAPGQDEALVWPDFAWHIVDGGLWLHADEYWNADHVVSFVQRFIRQCRPGYVFQMTWADTCSAPRPGAFGGGWLVVTQDTFRSGTVYQAVEQAVAQTTASATVSNAQPG